MTVYSVDRLYLSAVVVGNKYHISTYLVGFRDRRKSVAMCGKFSAASCRIWWQTGRWSFDKYAAENCAHIVTHCVCLLLVSSAGHK